MGVLKRHGISIGLERTDNDIFLRIKAVGKLTHKDYEVLSPMLDNAVQAVDHPKIRAFVDVLDLDGWELRAAWDDFTLGMKYGKEFHRVAIVGDKPWERVATKVAGWFISGETEYFEDEDSAMSWLGTT